MLDIQTLRNDLEGVAARLATRGFVLDTAKFEQLEAERKSIQARAQELQAKRNVASKLIGQAKANGEETTAIKAKVIAVNDELKQLEARLPQVLGDMEAFLANIPNRPHPNVPEGKSEADNVEMYKIGEPKKFDFEVQDHVSIGEDLGGMEKISK